MRLDTITATYSGDGGRASSQGSTTVKVLSITPLAHGSFVIGDQNASVGNISGNAPTVVVKTNPGYGPNPGHPGTGTVIEIVCP